MPMMLGPKKIVSVIMGGLPKEQEVNPALENDNEMALEACAEDMLKSIESKNVKALVEAMKNFHSLYDESMGEDYDDVGGIEREG